MWALLILCILLWFFSPGFGEEPDEILTDEPLLEKGMFITMLHFAIIGAGANVFRHHRAALEKLPGRIVALSDIKTTIGEQRARELGCAFYTEYQTMIQKEHPDVVVILTPTFLHAPIALACLRAGCHVLVEKPMALHVAEADAMIEAATHHQRSLGVIFQQRFRPEVLAAKALIEQGRLGKIQHVEVLASCPRPSSYYRAVPWRGTWAGEGGGVLMNQAPHPLDLLCYLLGMPAQVFAHTRRILHDIETEDTCLAQLEWPDGVLGSFCASTAFTGGHASSASEQSWITITGTAGSLRLQQDALSLACLDKDMRQFAREPPQPFPVARQMPVLLPPGNGNHLAVYRAFCESLQQGTRQTGEAARMSLEVANGLIWSGQCHQVVELPVDRQAYGRLLQELQKQASQRQEGREARQRKTPGLSVDPRVADSSLLPS